MSDDIIHLSDEDTVKFLQYLEEEAEADLYAEGECQDDEDDG